MTEAAPKPRRRRWKYLLIAGGVGIVTLFAGLWYTTTQSFASYVRRRMVAELEQITGGRAEIGSFHVVPFHMQVEVRDITVHGREAATDVPLAHADRLLAHVKVISFLRTEFGFYSLSLEHPVIHVTVNADGTTNLPAPAVPKQSSTTMSVDQLFALSIDHLSVHNGELIWGDRKTPLDFDVQGAGLQMDYSYLRGRYESRVSIGKVDTAFKDYRPFSWMTTVNFSLGTNAAEIKSLQWNSGRSHVQASGRIADFRAPKFDGNYEAHVDLADAAAILRRHDLQEGVADVKGNGHWSMDDFAASGALALRDLGWRDDQFVLKKASAAADYSLSDQQIKLSKLQGKIFSGSFTGDALVDNWLHSVPPATISARKGNENEATISAAQAPAKKGAKTKPPGVQTGAVHVKLRDLSISEMASDADVPAHPLGKFRPAGTATGMVDAVWRGSPSDAEIGFALDVEPAARPAAGELPVTAHLQGRYQAGRDELDLAQLAINTPASRLQASGKLAPSSTLHLSASTSDLDEWQPLISALSGPSQLPVRVNGSASFNGVVGGGLSSPAIAGNVNADDFDVSLPATSNTPAQSVHWDSLTASVQLSSHELALRGGELQRGATSADFDFTAGLEQWRLVDESSLSARVNLHHVDVASTAALAGAGFPATGTADVSLQISGTRSDPQVQGHIQAENASIYGEMIEKLDADLHFVGGETALNNIQLQHQDATVVGSLAYTPATRGFRLDLVGKNFDLSRVREFHLDELPVEGRGHFTLQGSGTIDNPVLNGKVHVESLTFDRELSGAFDVEIAAKGRQMRVTGRSDYPKGTIAVDGTVDLHGDFPATFTARFDHLDADPLWRAYLGTEETELTGHSAVAGTVTMQGPLRYPQRWILDGDLSDVSVELEHAKLHNQGPVRWRVEQQTISIQPTHMVGDGTDVTGHGSIAFAGGREIDLTADGQIELKLLSRFDPDLTASGNATVHLTVGGTVDEVQPRGTIQIENGAFSYASLPSGLSEMSGSLTITRDRAAIEKLTARTGGGTVDFKGEVTRYGGQVNFNVTATGKDVRLRYPPGVSSTADAELHWVGTPASSTVSGHVMVNKLAVTPGFDFGSYMERSRQSAAISPANSTLYNIKLDVAVRTAPELQMKTAVARLSGDADLHVRGSAARPSVLGRADILEGDATFNGTKFRLERGDITFANPVAIEPQVNLQATTHVRNYDLDITVTGTPDHLNVNYRSEPPLPKSDIVALLALGRTSEESEQLQQQSGQTPFTDEATALIINQAINATVSSRLQKLFGVSRVKIDPQGLSTETNPTARGPQITIEQQFANNVSLTYSTNVSQSSQQIIQGEYYINRNLSVVGTRDQNGVVSFDVRVRRRRK